MFIYALVYRPSAQSMITLFLKRSPERHRFDVPITEQNFNLTVVSFPDFSRRDDGAHASVSGPRLWKVIDRKLASCCEGRRSESRSSSLGGIGRSTFLMAASRAG